MYHLTMKSDLDDKNCNMQKSWNSFYIEISWGRIVAQSGLLIQFDAVGKLFRSTRFISKCIEPFFDGLMILDAFETYY